MPPGVYDNPGCVVSMALGVKQDSDGIMRCEQQAHDNWYNYKGNEMPDMEQLKETTGPGLWA
ncbi:MAG: hypothetical protein HZA16_02380 [Nitrospirae bacterium]|nr:hypothetical protein [Nitrospirota bacterium]